MDIDGHDTQRESRRAGRFPFGTWFHRVVLGKENSLNASFARLALRGLSIPYSVTVRFRNLAFDHGLLAIHRSPVPVISVGNMTTGGTGKTPMVEWIAQRVREQSIRVCILSRGYGVAEGPNDEALLLEQNLPDVPHLQDSNRVELARIAVEELESELLLLDDGFQHRRLHRDLDIVLIDATQPFGGGWTLPGGLLREPLQGITRADLVVLTRIDQVDADQRAQLRKALARWVPSDALIEVRFQPKWAGGSNGLFPLSRLSGAKVLAFAGVGNPESFRRSLRQLGAELIDFRVYPDHHGYRREDVQDLVAWAERGNAEEVVTTQKDWVKIRIDRLGTKPLSALGVETIVESGCDTFSERLQRVLSTITHRESYL